jgi:hypothetical protein
VRDAMRCPFGPVGVSYVPANRSDGFAEPAHGRVAAVRVAVFSAVGARQISGKKQILFSGMNQRGCNEPHHFAAYCAACAQNTRPRSASVGTHRGRYSQSVDVDRFEGRSCVAAEGQNQVV